MWPLGELALEGGCQYFRGEKMLRRSSVYDVTFQQAVWIASIDSVCPNAAIKSSPDVRQAMKGSV